MVLDLVFDGFSCISMVCNMQNHKVCEIFRILRNIEEKQANFCQKWVPELKNAKTGISRLLDLLLLGMSYGAEIWTRYRPYGGKKTEVAFFQNLADFQNGGHFQPQNGQNGQNWPICS